MNSFMSWIGGKKALRDEIVVRFPAHYSRYIEVFGGGGWVLFHKSPGRDFEVYNDFNPNLANLYRCVRDHPDELCDELRYTLNSRTDFDHIRNMLKTRTEIPDIKRAAYFYQLIRESYASGLDSFASQPHSMWNNFPLIHEACRRLQKVVIENKDFEKLIKQYDRPESFFYCDPPYYETENYYEDVGFTEKDHERLANCLCSIQGKFLLSYNDCPQIRDLYSKPGIMIESTSRLDKDALGAVSGVVQEPLYCDKIIACNDGFMVILLIILVLESVVGDSLVIEIIRRIGLVAHNIATMPLITQHLTNDA